MDYTHGSHGIKVSLARRLNDIELSKSILTAQVISPDFPRFVATFVYSVWHQQSFSFISNFPSPELLDFGRFVHSLLRVTKLSFSVVILALKLIHRIKCRRNLSGKFGSEYRLIVCCLNLAMKCLHDNCFSNKTWHKLSKIPLGEINQAELEFLDALHYDIHVGEESYFSWLYVVDESFAKFRATMEVNSSRQCLTPPLTPLSPDYCAQDLTYNP